MHVILYIIECLYLIMLSCGMLSNPQWSFG